METAPFNRSLGALYRQFRSLPSATGLDRQGFYRGYFVGPWWMRVQAPAFVFLTGLPGWLGKKFLNPDLAANVVMRGGQIAEGPRMRWVELTSTFDRRPGVGLRYESEAPMPWRWITDELRQVDPNTFLGMSVVDAAGLRRLGIPFLLVREG
jgi:hypothetical protein